MSSSVENVGSVKNTDTVNSAEIVIIMSHDLDDYSLLQYSVRREFAIGEVSTLIVSNPDLEIPPTTAGLQFKKYAGRTVKGYFCPPDALIAGNLLTEYQGEGLILIQLVPDIASYSKIRNVLRSLDEGKSDLARQAVTEGEMMKNAHKVSEIGFINLIGVFMAMPKVRNNPFAEGSRMDKAWINDPKLKKILEDPKFMLEFLKDKNVSYLMHRFDPMTASLRLMEN